MRINQLWASEHKFSNTTLSLQGSEWGRIWGGDIPPQNYNTDDGDWLLFTHPIDSRTSCTVQKPKSKHAVFFGTIYLWSLPEVKKEEKKEVMTFAREHNRYPVSLFTPPLFCNHPQCQAILQPSPATLCFKLLISLSWRTFPSGRRSESVRQTPLWMMTFARTVAWRAQRTRFPLDWTSNLCVKPTDTIWGQIFKSARIPLCLRHDCILSLSLSPSFSPWPCCRRWSQDWRGFGERRRRQCGCQNTACDRRSLLFSRILHFPSMEPQKKRERRSRLVFVLHSPAQREIFIMSFLWNREAEKEGDRREKRKKRVYVSPHVKCLSACTFLSYQTWWENISVPANNGRIMKQQAPLGHEVYYIWAGWVH